MSLERTERRGLGSNASLNVHLQTVTFCLTLPLPFESDGQLKSNTRSVLNCLARCVETSTVPEVKTALTALFDLIHERATPEEREFFPNWFEAT